MNPDSTLTHLLIVTPENFKNPAITFDGSTGDARIGDHWKDGHLMVNTRNAIAILDADAERGLIKIRSLTGQTFAVFDCKTCETYFAGKVHEGETPESLDKKFP